MVDEPYSLDLGCGGQLNIPSSLTSGGGGFQCGLNAYYHPDTQRLYGGGLQFNYSYRAGGDFFNDSDDSRLLLTLTSGTQSPLFKEETTGKFKKLDTAQNHIGFGSAGGGNLVLGRDSSIFSAVFKTEGRFPAFRLTSYFGTMTTIPFDSQQSQNIPLVDLRVGAELSLRFSDVTTTEPPPSLTELDIANLAVSQFLRGVRTYATGKALSGNFDLVQEYTGDLFGESGVPSARLDTVGTILIANGFTASLEDGTEQKLMFQGEGVASGVMLGVKAAQTLGFLLLSLDDQSTTTPTQGFAGLFQLGAVGIGAGMGLLNPSARKSLDPAKRKEAGRNFLIGRSLMNTAGILIGSLASEEKIGQAFLQGSFQAMLATTLSPDPAETDLVEKRSTLFGYEWNSNGGGYLGYAQEAHLISSNMYTRSTLFFQAFPGLGFMQDATDVLTLRNPLIQGAKAKVSSGVGLETQTGPITWSIGPRALLLYGEGSRAVPGIGLEGQMMFTLVDHLELGFRLAGDITGAGPQFGFSPVVGWR